MSYQNTKKKYSNKALETDSLYLFVWIPIHLSKNPERISVYDSLLKHKEYILFVTKLNAKDHHANICLDRHDCVYGRNETYPHHGALSRETVIAIKRYTQINYMLYVRKTTGVF